MGSARLEALRKLCPRKLLCFARGVVILVDAPFYSDYPLHLADAANAKSNNNLLQQPLRHCKPRPRRATALHTTSRLRVIRPPATEFPALSNGQPARPPCLGSDIGFVTCLRASLGPTQNYRGPCYSPVAVLTEQLSSPPAHLHTIQGIPVRFRSCGHPDRSTRPARHLSPIAFELYYAHQTLQIGLLTCESLSHLPFTRLGPLSCSLPTYTCPFLKHRHGTWLCYCDQELLCTPSMTLQSRTSPYFIFI